MDSLDGEHSRGFALPRGSWADKVDGMVHACQATRWNCLPDVLLTTTSRCETCGSGCETCGSESGVGRAWSLNYAPGKECRCSTAPSRKLASRAICRGIGSVRCGDRAGVASTDGAARRCGVTGSARDETASLTRTLRSFLFGYPPATTARWVPRDARSDLPRIDPAVPRHRSLRGRIRRDTI